MKFMIVLLCLLIGAQAELHIRARRDWFSDIKNSVADAGKTVFNGAKDVIENPGEHLEKAGTAIKEGAEKVGEVAAGAGETVYNGAKDVVEHPQENLEKAGAAIKEGASDVATGIKNTAEKGYESGKAFINNEESSVSEALSGPGDRKLGATHEEVSIFTL
uniref:Dauer Up-Regulated n=1 Tax=Bursaphelenchus xylophilus TaxID=6326 RepID=A0A1I7RLL3_BURXY